MRRLIKELDAEVFCCNTIPSRYESLGIGYEQLKEVREDIIWAGISALGPDYPNTPGYDPMVQAMAGYMEVTGDPDGPPMLSGIQLVDLKAGDEVYANVMLALLKKTETGQGARIDVSMLQAAASWLITTLPLLDVNCEPEEVTRWGNAHRKYIPTSNYRASDGYLYIAIGSNSQWHRLVATEIFTSLEADGNRATAEQRYADRAAIYRELGDIVSRYKIKELEEIFCQAKIPHGLVNTIPQVMDLEAVRNKATRTKLPDKTVMRMQPMAVDIENASMEYSLAPKHGEHTVQVLREAGLGQAEIERLRSQGVIQ